MTLRAFLLLCLLSASAAVRSEEEAVAPDPPRLAALRIPWEDALARQARPIKESYLDELIELRDRLTKTERLAEALLVKTEIERLTTKAELEEKAERPAELARLQSTFMTAIEKANNKTNSVYKKALEDLKSNFAKEGALESALAVTRELDRLHGKSGLQAKEPAPAISVVGEWYWIDPTAKKSIVEPHKTGRLEVVWSKSRDHKWRLEGNIVHVTWAHGQLARWELSEDDNTLTALDGDDRNKGVTLERKQ